MVHPVERRLDTQALADQPGGFDIHAPQRRLAGVDGDRLLLGRAVGGQVGRHHGALQVLVARVVERGIEAQAIVEEIRFVAQLDVHVRFRLIGAEPARGAGLRESPGKKTRRVAQINQRVIFRRVVEHRAKSGLLPLFAGADARAELCVGQQQRVVEVAQGQSRAAQILGASVAALSIDLHRIARIGEAVAGRAAVHAALEVFLIVGVANPHRRRPPRVEVVAAVPVQTPFLTILGRKLVLVVRQGARVEIDETVRGDKAAACRIGAGYQGGEPHGEEREEIELVSEISGAADEVEGRVEIGDIAKLLLQGFAGVDARGIEQRGKSFTGVGAWKLLVLFAIAANGADRSRPQGPVQGQVNAVHIHLVAVIHVDARVAGDQRAERIGLPRELDSREAEGGKQIGRAAFVHPGRRIRVVAQILIHQIGAEILPRRPEQLAAHRQHVFAAQRAPVAKHAGVDIGRDGCALRDTECAPQRHLVRKRRRALIGAVIALVAIVNRRQAHSQGIGEWQIRRRLDTAVARIAPTVVLPVGQLDLPTGVV